MLRLILFVFLLSGLVLALASVMVALRSAAPADRSQTQDTMPKPFRLISYTLLMLLMLGVTSGILGAT